MRRSPSAPPAPGPPTRRLGWLRRRWLLERPPVRTADWLTARPCPILYAVGCLALIVGVLAPRDPLAAVGLTLSTGLVLAVVLRPLIGGLVLAGIVPITSG